MDRLQSSPRRTGSSYFGSPTRFVSCEDSKMRIVLRGFLREEERRFITLERMNVLWFRVP